MCLPWADARVRPYWIPACAGMTMGGTPVVIEIASFARNDNFSLPVREGLLIVENVLR